LIIFIESILTTIPSFFLVYPTINFQFCGINSDIFNQWFTQLHDSTDICSNNEEVFPLYTFTIYYLMMNIVMFFFKIPFLLYFENIGYVFYNLWVLPILFTMTLLFSEMICKIVFLKKFCKILLFLI
jgi:hypothetical protein